MCQGNKSCTACRHKISGMKKGRRKNKQKDILGVGIQNLKSAGFALAGYGAAEAIGNVAANNISFLNTSNARIGVKAGAALLTGWATVVYAPQYKEEGLLLATGMGTNALKDVVGKFLPDSVTQYLPSVNGTPMRISSRASANQFTRGRGADAQFTRGGIAA